MKLQARHIFFLKIGAIVLLSLVGAWLFLKQLLFSSMLLLLIILALAVSLYYDRKKTARILIRTRTGAGRTLRM